MMYEHMIGAWQQEAVVSEADVVKAPNDIGACYASSLSSPCTSLRLLRDFVNLKKGDVIIQNAANSMIGHGVVQMAREFGFKTINIVRDDRPEAETELRLLANLGGDVNLLSSQVNNASFKELLADLPPLKLALNAVGGDSAVELARALSPGGTLVTYGGMSRQAPNIPLDLLADKNLQLKSFWMTKWSQQHSKEEKIAMFDEIAALIKDGQLAYFFELHDMDDFDYALKRATTPYTFRKVVLDMNFPDRMAEHDQLTEWDYSHFKYPPLKY